MEEAVLSLKAFGLASGKQASERLGGPAVEPVDLEAAGGGACVGPVENARVCCSLYNARMLG